MHLRSALQSFIGRCKIRSGSDAEGHVQGYTLSQPGRWLKKTAADMNFS